MEQILKPVPSTLPAERSLEDLLNLVAKRFETTSEQVASRLVIKRVTWARRIAALVMYQNSSVKLKKIGQYMGGRTAAEIDELIEAGWNLIQTNKQVESTYDSIDRQLDAERAQREQQEEQQGQQQRPPVSMKQNRGGPTPIPAPARIVRIH